MTDDEIIQALVTEYRAGRRGGLVRRPEYDRLLDIARRGEVEGLTVNGNVIHFDPPGCPVCGGEVTFVCDMAPPIYQPCGHRQTWEEDREKTMRIGCEDNLVVLRQP